MIAFPSILAEAGRQAGMKVPEDPEADFDIRDYPHFNVFCVVQLGKAVRYHGEHFDNAKVIAKIPEKKIRKLTYAQLLKRGFSA